MVMVSLTDNSRGNSSVPQNAWRFDFERPLVALSDLQDAFGNMNYLMGALTNGQVTTGQLTGSQVPSQQVQPDQQKTIPTVGGLSGGGSSFVVTRTSSGGYMGIESGGYPFSGIS